jgi:amino acid adenylation domain-containing protein
VTNTVLQGFRLSPQQARLRALREAAPDVAFGVAGTLRLRGELDREALRKAVAAVTERHEILRTTFHVLPEGGVPVQVVGEAAAALEYRDLAGLPEAERGAVEAASWRTMVGRHPEAHEAPLRAVLLQRGHGDHVLYLGLSALCADTRTLDTLAAEIGAAYAELAGANVGEEIAGEPFQYVDFSEWLHETLTLAEAAEGRSFWGRQRAPETAALPDLWPEAVPADAHGSAVRHHRMAADTGRRLDLAASARGTDAEAWLLAVWRVLLQSHLGEDGFTVGVAADGRVFEEMRGGMGPFTRYLPLPGDVDGAEAFAALAAVTAEELRQARAWQAFHSWPESAGADTPYVRFGFDYAEAPLQDGRWGGVEWSMERRWHRVERFDLHLSVERVREDGETGVRVSLQHDPATLAPEGAARLLRRYAALLEGTLTRPSARADALPLLDDREREEALGRAAADASFPVAEPLHRLFERQAARTPDAVALAFEEESLTYRELDQRASRLARHLRGRGVGLESRVALCVERSPEMIVGILGILKAGGAYVPLDPAYPEERLAYVLEDAGVRVLLVQDRLRGRIPAANVEVITLDAEWERIPAEETGPVPGDSHPDALAYIIYTSGSTGRPKGVQVTHANVVRLFLAIDPWFGFGPDDVWSLFHSFAFDVSVCEMWGALLHGGKLVVVPFLTSRTPEELYRLLVRERVSVLSQTPSAFRQLIAAEEAVGTSLELALRYVLLAGEALEPGTLRGWMERHGEESPRVVNMYGITETTVHVTYRVIGRGDVERGGRSPVGIPMPDLRVYVLDRHLEPVPVGVPGEMYVSGAGVVRGYLDRPELTAQRFIPDPFGQPGTRLYRSGDLARRLPVGELEYLGRLDQQVKIRGFRIEPGEIEAVLLTHPAVREAVVVAREDGGGERRLAAYVTAAGTPPTAGDLRVHLQGALPEYMVPSSFMILDRLPLTNNGKLDRRALPAPDLAAGTEAEYVAPRTPSEEVLAAVWSEVLGLERVGIDDNFFTVGGDSILSVRVAALARDRGIELAIEDLFAHRTIREQAERAARATPESAALDAILSRGSRPFDLIPEEDRRKLPEDAEDAFPLASLQGGMLYHQALTREAPVYHNVDSYHFRGAFDEGCFRAAVQAAVDRQENLRTSIHLTGFSEPVQVVHRRAEIPVQVEDIRHLDGAAQDALLREIHQQEWRTPFDITRAPLMRMRVHLRADDRFHLTVAENHAINDGWSYTSLFADIFEDHAALMRGEPIRERTRPAMRFRDYIELERAVGTSEASRRYWEERLTGFVPGTLPYRFGAVEDAAHSGTELVEVPISSEVQEGLARLARSLAVPLKSVLLAAHVKALGVSMGVDDVVTGLSTNGRPEVAGGTDVRGLFLNTVPLRVELGEGSWEDLVRQTFHAEAEMLPHRRYPIARLQQAHGHERLFEVTFNLVRFHSFADVLKKGVVEIISGDELGDTSQMLQVAARLNPLTSRIRLFGFSYRIGSLSPEQARELAERYRRIMEEMVADPAGRHDRFFPLAGAERRRVLEEWNRTEVGHPADRCVHQLFEDQAERTPAAVALASGGRELTYGELNERANRLAHRLVGMGVGPEVRVGLFLERNPEMVVSVLAVLKAGGAYVPLDPAYPAERLAFMLGDSGAAVLLTQEKLRGTLPARDKVRVLSADGEWAGVAAESGRNPAGGASLGNLAYVIYTSGSTGTPKGVAVDHQGVSSYLAWATRTYPGRSSAVHSSLSFDLTVTSLFVPLLRGGRVELVEETEAVEGLAKRLERGDDFGTLKLTPTHLRVLGDRLEGKAVHGRAECLVVGGEALTGEHLAAWSLSFPDATVVNEYGPTEATVGCCVFTRKLSEVGSGPVPIGRPTPGTRLYVLDRSLNPVPAGVAGELYIGGAQVARGYLGRPALTAERFVPDALSREPGTRLYRTGDRVRWTPDGMLEYLGRLDEQVKVRGFRVELGEIEAALGRHEAVRERIVVAREDVPGDPQLVAYVVGDAEPGALREHLQRSLPEYMVPAAFVTLRALPLTPNGKVDRKALPAPEYAQVVKRWAAPRTPTEEVLAGMWAELLKRERVGVDENFAELGGHSLLAIRMLSRIRAAFGVELSLRAVFEHPTIASLAQAVDSAAGRVVLPPPIVAEERVEAVLAGMDEMSEEEVDRLLSDLSAGEEQEA